MKKPEKTLWRKRLLDPAAEAEEHSKARQETATLVREIVLATRGPFDEAGRGDTEAVVCERK
jgi:hypothetical protein